MIRNRILRALNRVSDTLHRMNEEPVTMCPVPMPVPMATVTAFPTDKVSMRTGVQKSGKILPFIRK